MHGWSLPGKVAGNYSREARDQPGFPEEGRGIPALLLAYLHGARHEVAAAHDEHSEALTYHVAHFHSSPLSLGKILPGAGLLTHEMMRSTW